MKRRFQRRNPSTLAILIRVFSGLPPRWGLARVGVMWFAVWSAVLLLGGFIGSTGLVLAHTQEEKAFYLQSRIVLRLNPGDARAGNAVGVWHLEYKQLAPAREAFTKVLGKESSGDGTAGISAMEIAARVGLALIEEIAGRPEAALKHLTTIGNRFERAPQDLPAFLSLLRGRLLVRLGRPDDAARALTNSLAKGGYAHDVYFWRGRIHEEAGRPREAVAAFEQAIASDPSWPEPFARLSALHQQLGDTARAKQVLEQVLELHNASPYPNNDIRVLWRWVMNREG